MEGSLLGRLPRELRDQIYNYVYPPPDQDEGRQSKSTTMAILVNNQQDVKLLGNHEHRTRMALTQTCSQIRKEVGSVKPLAGRKFHIHLAGHGYRDNKPNSRGLPTLSFLAAYLKHLGGDALNAIDALVLDVKYGDGSFTLQRNVVNGKVMVLYSVQSSWHKVEEDALYNVVVKAYKEAGVSHRPSSSGLDKESSSCMA